MPFAARVRLPAIAALILAASAGRLHAEMPEGTYVSMDDYLLMEAGLIVPIVEYVEVEQHVLTGATIESGYLHILPDPRTMLDVVAWSISRPQSEPAVIGRLDLAGTRRIALVADAEVAPEQLSWVPEFSAMTSHEPGRLPVGEQPRLSPLLLATDAAQDTGGTPSVRYRMDGDVLRITGPGGGEHSYRRTNPATLRMIGLIAMDQNISIAQIHSCLRPIAEILATGEPFVFSDQAIAAMRDWAEAEGPEALATWAEMERRGLGQLQNSYYGTAIAALGHAGRFLQSRVERAGGLPAMLEGWDGQESLVDDVDDVILMYLARFFYYDFDYISAHDPPFDSLQDLMAIWEAQYEVDPFSVTSPFAVAYLDRHGWIVQLQRLMWQELTLRCPALEGREQ